jgi:diguanylate cyclase (GGDEF)-like protein
MIKNINNSSREKYILRVLTILTVIGAAALIVICFAIKGNGDTSSAQEIVQWERINADGSGQTENIPILLDDNDQTSIRGTLPTVHDDQSLMIKVNFSTMEVKIDGETVYSVGTTSIGNIQTMIGNYIAFVPLKDSYSGKTIQLNVRTRDSRFTSAIKHTDIVNLSEFVVAQAQRYSLNLAIAVLYCLLSILMFGLWLAFVFGRIKLEGYSKEVYAYAAAFLLSIGIWTISDVHIAGMLFQNLTASGLINYLAFNLLPIGCMGLTKFLYAKNSRVMNFLVGIAQLSFIIQCILFIFGIVDFPQMLPVTQTIFVMAVIAFIVFMVDDVIHDPVTEKKINLISAVLAGIAVIISVYLYLIDKSLFSWLTFAIVIIVINVVQKLLSVAFQMMRNGIKVQELRIYAYTDYLTKLFNRMAYAEDVEKIEKRNDRQMLILGQFDVNGLKITNDSLGHCAGDELLKAVAKCIKNSFGTFAKCYRMGGDEFAVLAFTDKSTYEAAERKFKEQLANWHGTYIHGLSVSMGNAVQSEHPEASITDLEKLADTQMYQAKHVYYSTRNLNRRKSS